MEAERWRKLEQLYHSALELETSQRAAFIEKACGGDASLKQELGSLLAQSEGADSFLEAPAMEVAAQALALSEAAPPEYDPLKPRVLLENARAEEDGTAGPAGVIGSGTGLEAGQVFSQRFHLVRKLGEGGMGQVWLAEQASPLRRLVALKLIKGGIFDSSLVRHFQSERQSLAIMDHPTIAKVFEAGTTEQGQPYFVMEYVPGLPITDYCDEKKTRDKAAA